MATHNILNAVNAGMKGYQQGVKTRKDADHLKATRAAQLADTQYRQDIRPDADLVREQQEAKIADLENTQRINGGKTVMTELNTAMRNNLADGNDRHFNFLRSNPYAKDLLGGLTRFEGLNPDNKEDQAYLMERLIEVEAQDGDQGNKDDGTDITPTDLNDPEFWKANPVLLRRFKRGYNDKGEMDYTDLNALKAISGYWDQENDLAIEKETAELDLATKRKKYLEEGNGKPRKLTAFEIKTMRQAEAKDNITAGKGTTLDIIRSNAADRDNREGRSVVEKNAIVAGNAKAKAFDRAGGRKAFLALDFTDSDVIAEYRDDADVIMSAKGQKFSNKEKDTLNMVRRLSDASETITDGLDEDSTGIIDNFLQNVNKFNPWANTDVDSTAARSAYNRMFNIILQGRSGAAVSAQEMARMKKEYGSLDQQFAPVMVQIKEQLRDMRSSLGSVGAFKDEVVRSVYLSSRMTDVDQVMSNIDDVLAELDGVKFGSGRSKTPREGSRRSRRNSRAKAAPSKEEMSSLWDEFQ